MSEDYIEKEFHRAVAFVNSRDGSDLKMSDEKKLEIYALYKQSTEGDAPRDKKVGFLRHHRERTSFLY